MHLPFTARFLMKQMSGFVSIVFFFFFWISLVYFWSVFIVLGGTMPRNSLLKLGVTVSYAHVHIITKTFLSCFFNIIHVTFTFFFKNTSDDVGFNRVSEWFAFNISARMIYVTFTGNCYTPTWKYRTLLALTERLLKEHTTVLYYWLIRVTDSGNTDS